MRPPFSDFTKNNNMAQKMIAILYKTNCCLSLGMRECPLNKKNKKNTASKIYAIINPISFSYPAVLPSVSVISPNAPNKVLENPVAPNTKHTNKISNMVEMLYFRIGIKYSGNNTIAEL